PGYAVSVAIEDNYAYVADFNSGIQIVDISNSENPFIASSVNMTGYVYDIGVKDNYAYAANFNSGLQVIDIRNPLVPITIGSVNSAYAIAVTGDYVYIADWGSGLQVVHRLSAGTIADPINFVDSSTLNVIVPDGLMNGKYNIKIVNSSGEETIFHNSFTVLESTN
ncbi:hypothetical protein HZA55_03690, partial [Candidatus Poribacteria bacterium]|nr:hypothetical protein [Candidatus Poribacteria bacterium]